jgi:hypothetical protein
MEVGFFKKTFCHHLFPWYSISMKKGSNLYVMQSHWGASLTKLGPHLALICKVLILIKFAPSCFTLHLNNPLDNIYCPHLIKVECCFIEFTYWHKKHLIYCTPSKIFNLTKVKWIDQLPQHVDSYWNITWLSM